MGKCKSKMKVEHAPEGHSNRSNRETNHPASYNRATRWQKDFVTNDYVMRIYSRQLTSRDHFLGPRKKGIVQSDPTKRPQPGSVKTEADNNPRQSP